MLQYLEAATPLPNSPFPFFSGLGEMVPEPSHLNLVLAIAIA